MHEHHHHHHDHDRQASAKGPQGVVRYLPDLDRPVTMPSFPDKPDLERPVIMPVPLPVFPDAPEENEPVILPFPSAFSPQCRAKAKIKDNFIQQLFEEDPLFKHTADM
ncbi:hypothetical protein AAFF_G00004020 [Aldrovandia affinis]|uniref:Uncharacterized protein n=1 Tax=Aldrovandia affinis TaxID=143900 RepID=A0AAD7X3R0_9TELE|nr:hypothetical protein AAFF_G00004020 [Aldrovandia affinis]